MKYYLDTIERLRFDTVEEALAFRDECAEAEEYEVESFSYTEKYDKKADYTYVIAKVKKVINKEKEPVSNIRVTYNF